MSQSDRTENRRGSTWRGILTPLCVFITVTCAPVTAQDNENFVTVRLPEASAELRIDGRLNESIWLDAVSVDLPWETSPAVNGVAGVATRCRLARDATHLFLGCLGHDPSPGAIRAQIVDRDGTESHDRITLYLDPFDDGQRAFIFSVSAVGVQGDGILDQTRGETDYSWNAIWASAGRIHETGYTVELAIPFRSLRFPATRGGDIVWRFFIERTWPRSQEITLRSTGYDPDDPCRLCYAHRLDPGAIEKPAANIETVPTLTVARTDRRSAPGSVFQTGRVDPDLGLDVRWGLSTQSGVNVTVNPDFSQIESDALQLEANTRFALFVPERRPFFLEEAEIFQSPLRVVFTRSIADPVAGAKLAGRQGDWSGGVLYARDASTNLLIPGSFGSSTTALHDGSNAFAGRISRRLNPDFIVGGLMTRRTATDYRNSVLGFDAFVRPLRALEIRTQLLGSATAYPSVIIRDYTQFEGTFHDHAFQSDARWNTRNWSAHARVESIGRNFRADLGFLPQVDTRRLESSLTRRLWGDNIRWLTRFDGSIGQWTVLTQTNQLKERGIWSQLSYHGPLQIRLSINPFWMRETFHRVEYSRSGVNVTASTSPNADVVLAVNGRRASAIDYTYGRLAREWELGANADFRVGRRLSFEASVNRQSLRFRGLLVVREDIARIRSQIGVSSRAFISLVTQFRSERRDQAVHERRVIPRNASLQLQGIFTYRLDGHTALFLGYSDLHSQARPELGRISLQRQSLTWFFKLSYAWRP